MDQSRIRVKAGPARVLLLLALLSQGCQSSGLKKQELTPLPPVDVPRELKKVALPDYVIEPPDVLRIEAMNLAPRGPHRVAPMDVLAIQATPSFPEQPISGPYVVDAAGAINFGPTYGVVPVAGLTIDEASRVLQGRLAQILKDVKVSVSLLQTGMQQQISGEHLVGPDGTVNLGFYGRVFVTGITIEQARERIAAHLSRFAYDPRVAVDIGGYNSKTYYIITEGAGLGDGVARFPVTGNETVLDAIAQINGLSQVSSKKVWIARPSPDHIGCDQVLPVDWVAVTKGGSTTTNYQVLPGDRIFIAEDHLVAADTQLGKFLAPIERILGVTLLGASAAQTISNVNSPVGGVLIP